MAKLVQSDDLPIWMVHSSEMDFLTLIEHDCPPPIAFKNRHALQRWIDVNPLIVKRVGKRDEEEKVALVEGNVALWGSEEGLSYSQVWVSVNYTRYRNALKFQIKSTGGGLKTVDLYDADHAVGETRLKRVWPDAWVNMVLIPSEINRAIGAMMEKRPLVVAENQSVAVNTECILKTFLKRKGALQQGSIKDYLKEARSRFIQMRSEVGNSQLNSLDARLHVFAMSNNATVFFDSLARESGVSLLD